MKRLRHDQEEYKKLLQLSQLCEDLGIVLDFYGGNTIVQFDSRLGMRFWLVDDNGDAISSFPFSTSEMRLQTESI